MTAVRMCTFSGASSLPLLIARQRGFFRAFGLDVDLTSTRSSDELMRGLVDGQFDIVHAAPDNYIAWRDREGTDVVAWVGGASGPIRLIADPSIERPRDLARRPIAVDAVASGFVSVMRKILRADGLADADVELVELGSTQLRFEALKEGRASATMLTVPYSVLAMELGFRSLGDQRDVMPRLQGSCAGSMSSWLSAHPDLADAYLRSICASLTWLYTPGHEEEANTFIADHYGIETRHADEVRREIVDPVRGWSPSAMIDPVGIETVCELRRENGTPALLPPEAYYSFEPYRRVLGFGQAQG